MAMHRKYDKKNCVICHLQVVIIPKLQFVIFKYIKNPGLPHIVLLKKIFYKYYTHKLIEDNWTIMMQSLCI